MRPTDRGAAPPRAAAWVRRAALAVGLAAVTVLVWGSFASAEAQARRPPRAQAPRRPAAPLPPPVTEAAQVACPNPLGEGASTKKAYCDVLTALDVAEGVRIAIPPHRGEATVSFDLHNRQTYSEQQVRAGRAYARYTATVRIIGPEGEELMQAVVQSEFRTERDLVERILGGAGPGGLKAVAPTGSEPIVVTVPEKVTEIIVVGQRLVVEGLERREQFGAPGRPVATISSVMVEYRPSTAKPATPAAAPKPSAPSKPSTTAKPAR